MVGAQKFLLTKAHSTDPGTEVSVMVTINFITIITLIGKNGCSWELPLVVAF